MHADDCISRTWSFSCVCAWSLFVVFASVLFASVAFANALHNLLRFCL